MAGRWAHIKKWSTRLWHGGPPRVVSSAWGKYGVWVLGEGACVIKSTGAAPQRCCIIQFRSTPTSKQHVVCCLKWCCRSYATAFQVSGWWEPWVQGPQLRSSRQSALWLWEMSGLSGDLASNTNQTMWYMFFVINILVSFIFWIKRQCFQPHYRSSSHFNIGYGSHVSGICVPSTTLGL